MEGEYEEDWGLLDGIPNLPVFALQNLNKNGFLAKGPVPSMPYGRSMALVNSTR
jgi:hypothetical protein